MCQFSLVLLWCCFVLQMASMYGNIFTLWLTGTPVVVLHGYQAVKEGMTAHAEEVAGRPLSRAFRLMTNGNGNYYFIDPSDKF